MKPSVYPKYKSSGVLWLGQVPDHWDVVRLGSLLCERGEVNGSKKVTHVLSLLRGRGVIPYDEKGKIGNKKSDDISRYKIVRPDDIVVNCMNVIIGSVGISSETGCLSPVYYVFVRRHGDQPRYMNAIFQCSQFHRSLVRIGNGILAHRMRIPIELLKCELLPRPPLSEQGAIVRYLDYMDRRIRRYIGAKRKLIGLLEEQKRLVIHRAVTRGLNPDVPLKDSGVEWLGKVPEHWQNMPGRKCFIERKIRNIGLTENTVLSLSYGKIVVKPPEKLYGLVPASFETYQIIEPNDIVVRPTDLQNDWNSLRFGIATVRGIITSAYICFRTTEHLTPYFGYLLLHTYDLKKIFYGLGSGLRQNLDWRDFKYLPCILPPLNEQTAIAEYLDTAVANVDTAISRARREIELLNEYRTRLIADVVTGKVDVREAAASLPDESEELDPFNEEDELPGDGEVMEDGQDGAIEEAEA